jgi:hypothetical protein
MQGNHFGDEEPAETPDSDPVDLPEHRLIRFQHRIIARQGQIAVRAPDCLAERHRSLTPPANIALFQGKFVVQPAMVVVSGHLPATKGHYAAPVGTRL